MILHHILQWSNLNTQRERVKNQPTKTTVYLAFDQIVFAVNGIRKHFIQCLLEVNNNFTWRNPDYFLLSSTARQVLCLGWFHEWKLLKISFLPFPSMVATQYKFEFVEEPRALTVNPHLIPTALSVLSKFLSFRLLHKFPNSSSCAVLKKNYN